MADWEIRRIADSTPRRCAVPTVRWRVTLTVLGLAGESPFLPDTPPCRCPVAFPAIRFASLPSCLHPLSAGRAAYFRNSGWFLVGWRDFDGPRETVVVL